jgi:hypothetical protein
MRELWLEIPDPSISAEEIQLRVQARIAGRDDAPVSEVAPDPAAIAESLYLERFGRSWDGPVPDEIVYLEHDYDIVPGHYVIDWRVPILGPIHAIVRRVINAEIRRYLLPALQKQSHLNKRMLQKLTSLQQENAELRRELQRLGGGKE